MEIVWGKFCGEVKEGIKVRFGEVNVPLTNLGSIYGVGLLSTATMTCPARKLGEAKLVVDTISSAANTTRKGPTSPAIPTFQSKASSSNENTRPVIFPPNPHGGMKLFKAKLLPSLQLQ
ncbi:MAG: hypothetical protein CL675_13565 [Bdellovibrionaceae bacterium]|mgnify:CR=1|nr:hypothetical protein [Pseudobdellovibrionaceae bacterium]